MKSTGNMMTAYTVQHLTPFAMSTDDLDMACRISQSTGNLLLSYKRVRDEPPYQASITTLASAAACAEVKGWEAELANLRAIKRGDTAGAAEARIVEKRWRHLAAARNKRAYDALVALYGEPGTGCSELFKEDGAEGRRHQLAYMIGLIAGVQAVRHDRASGALLGVPADIGKKAARGTECLDNERWWGMPKALQAAIWVGLPGGVPEGVDAWKQLEDSAQIAAKKGIRLAMAAQIQALEAAGKTDAMRAAIKAFAQAGEGRTGDGWRKYQLLDLQAEQQILALSDRLWTQAQGHRTPIGELGSFWDDAVEATEGADLLNGLDEEDADPPVDPTPNKE